MQLFSYKITRDYGFAPNPFHGFCTLATCKPQIREAAVPGSMIVGCGSSANALAGRVIFAMRVGEKHTFQEYWDDVRFERKRPNFKSSRAHAYGDNIYHKDEQGRWLQERSHHSLSDGSLNELNLARDTSSDSVLVGEDFVYFGRRAPEIPRSLRNFDGDDLYPDCRSHRCHFDDGFVRAVDRWFRGLPRGIHGRPAKW